MERPTPVGNGLQAAILIIIVLLVVLPFVSVIATSLASQKEISNSGGLVLIPLHPTLLYLNDTSMWPLQLVLRLYVL